MSNSRVHGLAKRRPLRRLLTCLAIAFIALGLFPWRLRPPQRVEFISQSLVDRTTVAAGWNGVAACLSQPGEPEPEPGAALIKAVGTPGKKVAGFWLTDASETDAEALRRLASTSDRSPSPEDRGRCHDLDCAARLLFGDERGPRYLYLALAFHFVVAGPKGRAPDWSAEDLTQVTLAFRDLPPNLFPFEPDGWRALRRSHSRVEVAHSSIGDADLIATSGDGERGMTVSAGWDEVRDNERRATIVHELAHEFTRARGRSFNWRDLWLEVTAADQRLATTRGIDDVRVSRYAATNIDEDFAESAAAYRYIPLALRSRAPNRYAFLKDWMFDGLEYVAAAKCVPALARSERVKRATIADIAAQPLDAALVRRVWRGCGESDARARCAMEGAYVLHYRRAWSQIPAAQVAASLSALNALLANTAFVDRAIGELPPQSRGSLALELVNGVS